MRDTFAIAALRWKRAHQAGDIEAAERQLAVQREVLAQIDTAIGLFDPGVDPSAIRSIRTVRALPAFPSRGTDAPLRRRAPRRASHRTPSH
jgi:hypothetical protein